MKIRIQGGGTIAFRQIAGLIQTATALSHPPGNAPHATSTLVLIAEN